ncbi:hypothetical protein BAUCODRAFT_333228 [Baudoinia panamericana UAMH 10762]|uniref:Deacetylase sirtuin-type domain-containing protein n=1 Tax=Baudoinia panamericana (strain UAMH 10762) TaxID=717646 RepID=M2LB35_BAUPA|nr:uncharacterized protein BAUCODRAFT_333228 [Baudoinia panamericana UAMH 10762]EMC91022.1 hypothetical protein BAUCODRAFT_333228 [Baudoinia panamericana UAMH 10762]
MVKARAWLQRETASSLVEQELFDPADLSDAPATADMLQTVARQLLNKRQIIVFTGAGISTAAGISCFQGPYNANPQARMMLEAFQLNNFENDFWTFITELRQQCKGKRPTVFHRMIDGFSQRQQLKWTFTQNIDGLERLCGHLGDKVTYLHGRLDQLRCTKNAAHKTAFEAPNGVYGECPVCIELKTEPPGDSGDIVKPRRSSRIRDQVGRLRPDIVLYGEDTPEADSIGEQIRNMKLAPQADALIIAGTSMTIAAARNAVETLKAGLSEGSEVFWVNLQRVPKSIEHLIDVPLLTSTERFGNAVLDMWRQQSTAV